MYTLLCTSYKLNLASMLILRNNWIETVYSDEELTTLINKWQLPNDFKYPSHNSISNILEGKMELADVIIHARIIKF